MDDWNTTFLLWWPIFRCELLVSGVLFSVCFICYVPLQPLASGKTSGKSDVSLPGLWWSSSSAWLQITHHEFWAPKMVVKSNGHFTKFQGNLGWWNIIPIWPDGWNIWLVDRLIAWLLDHDYMMGKWNMSIVWWIGRQSDLLCFCWQWSRQELPSHFCLPCHWGSIPDPPPPRNHHDLLRPAISWQGGHLGGWHRSPWDLMSVILHGAIVPWFPWWRRSKNFTKLIMNGCNTTRQSKSRSGWRWKSQ